MALPTFFIIGAAKAGTTSLHHYLSLHPEIQMSATKEPNFFAGPNNGVPYAPGTIVRLDEYESLFDPAYAVRGEASTDYSTHPRRQGAPARIKAAVPAAKFVYLVRDPIDRTISHHQMRTALLGERRSLAEALSDLRDPRSPYVWPSLYASQLERYLEHFAQERILVVDQARLRSERRDTLREIFAFLEVDPAVRSDDFERELLGSRASEWRVYSPGYVKFVSRVTSSPVRRIPKPLRRGVRRLLERVLWRPLPPAALDEDLRARLRQLYAPEAQRLRALTGQQFATWSV